MLMLAAVPAGRLYANPLGPQRKTEKFDKGKRGISFPDTKRKENIFLTFKYKIMNVKEKAINETVSLLPSVEYGRSDGEEEYRTNKYAKNAENVKIELNNLIWMYSPPGLTIEKAEAISSVMLEMIFYPEEYLHSQKTQSFEKPEIEQNK